MQFDEMGSTCGKVLMLLPEESLVSMALSMQDQMNELNSKMDYLIGQIALANNYRYGRHTEKLG